MYRLVVVLRPHNVGTVGHGILVGAGGTERSLTTLEFAYRQASLRGLPLTVMHCFWDVRSATIGSGIVPDDEPDLELKRELLSESVAGMTEKFPDVPVRKVLARGLTDKCLVAAAEPMDMVVVGARERGSLSGMVYGPVASAVVEHASSIVAVVPHDHQAELVHGRENGTARADNQTSLSTQHRQPPAVSGRRTQSGSQCHHRGLLDQPGGHR